MAWTTPGTATAGNVLTAAFWNENVRDNLNAAFPVNTSLTSYTPTLAQGASTNIAKAVAHAKYMVVGKVMYLWVRLFSTSTGSAGSAITVSLPAGYTADNGDGYVGSGVFGDSGVGDYTCLVYVQTTTTLALLAMTTTNGNRVGVTPAITVANNDGVSFHATIPLA